MVKFYYDLEQRSPQWFEHKLGKLGASMVKNILDVRKKMQLKSPDVVLTMVARIVAEIETGFSCDSDYISDDMEWGVEQEEQAKDLVKTKDCYENIGGVTNDKFKYFWLSPDLISDKKGWEIKCQSSKMFAKIVIQNKIPSDLLPQILAYMVVMPDLESVDLVLFDPRFKNKKLHTITANRDDYTTQLEHMEESLIEFDRLVDESLKLFKNN